ncbi:uncharacterized protein METZ01_LOCUS193054, partial [marine metagenome]
MEVLQNIWQGIANYWRLVAEIS